MDIANVVFVCGRHIRRDDPSLKCENIMYYNTVEGFSFCFLQIYGPNLARAVKVCFGALAFCPTSIMQTPKHISLPPRYRGSLLVMRQLVSHIWRFIFICADWPYGIDEQEFSVYLEKFSLHFSSSSFAIRVSLLHS